MNYEVTLFDPTKAPEFLEDYIHYTQDDGNPTLPVELCDVLESHTAHFGAFAGDTLAGYVAITRQHVFLGRAMLEVGSLVVLPEYQGNGMGSELVHGVTHHVTAMNPSALLIAFCHPNSEGSFTANGYKQWPPILAPRESRGVLFGFSPNAVSSTDVKVV